MAPHRRQHDSIVFSDVRAERTCTRNGDPTVTIHTEYNNANTTSHQLVQISKRDAFRLLMELARVLNDGEPTKRDPAFDSNELHDRKG